MPAPQWPSQLHAWIRSVFGGASKMSPVSSTIWRASSGCCFFFLLFEDCLSVLLFVLMRFCGGGFGDDSILELELSDKRCVSDLVVLVEAMIEM